MRRIFRRKGQVRLRSHIDTLTPVRVAGWAMDPRNVAARPGIELRVGDRIIAAGRADGFRSDLLTADIGDGRYGFDFEFSPALSQSELTALSIFAVEVGIELDRPYGTVSADKVSIGSIPTNIDLPDLSELSILFDVRYYVEQLKHYPREPTAGSFLSHYRQIGWKLGLNPHPMFDTNFYLKQVDSTIINDPLTHFFQIGLARLLSPHPLCDITYCTQTRPDVVKAGQHPLIHYLQHGYREGVSLSPLFDPYFYASQIKQRSEESVPDDGLSHYRQIGWKLGLNPHPLFDTEFYLQQAGGTISGDPLTHFLQEGQSCFLSPHPLCDIAYCTQNRPDIAQTGQHPLVHYLQYGYMENVNLSPLFDLDFYIHQIGEEEIDTGYLIHYLKFGWREGLKPHREFDPLLFKKLMNLDDGVEPYGCIVKLLASASRIDIEKTHPVKFSFVILNLNKTVLTLQCLAFILAFTDRTDYEVIVVDNGSGWSEFANLCRYAPFVRIVRSESNLGFGEGNNLGVDHANGEFLIFLNNDAFVTEGWLPPLLAVIENDTSVGAAGPKFLYADGRLQEAGGWMSADGTPIQRGKGLDTDDALFNDQCTADYCSAATLIMRAQSFRKVLGFDLCFDPAYYEDVDLCLKLRLIGEKTVYVPTSEVVHLEHATAADRSLGLQIEGISQVNRVKFVARWGRFLAGQSDGALERRLIPERPCPPPGVQPDVKQKQIALFSPYPLTPGGGERFLLSFAAALREDYACTLFTNTRYSRERLLTLARELDLPLDHVTIARWGHNNQRGPFDVFVCMSNEVLPAVPAMGRTNLFVCQFPFPMSPGVYPQRWENLEGYDAIIGYSQFVVDHTAAAAAQLGLALPPSHILSPPVPNTEGNERRSARPIRIVNVGRFTPAGHCKRQDVMVEAFRNICKTADVAVELHLVGALGSAAADREYLVSVQRAARGLPVKFHLNATPEHINSLYGRASVYWHMTGANDDVRQKPERFEHFGITIGEAMSAGAIPIALRHGGPGEIITDGRNGYLVSNADELCERTVALLAMSEPDLSAMREAARTRAKDFAMDRFETNLRTIIQHPTKSQHTPA